MKISLPFPINCSHSLPGKRATATANVQFEKEFEIAEVSIGDTILAARSYNDALRIDIEYRFHEGSFYRPANDTGKAWLATDLLKPTAGYERNYANLLANLDVAQAVGWEWEWSMISLYHPASGFKHLKESSIGKLYDADAEIAKTTGFVRQAVQDRALVIDGNVWIKIDEPHLIARLPDRPQMEIGSVSIAVNEQLLRPNKKSGIRRGHVYRPPAEEPCFRLDRIDDFKDYLVERRKKLNLETKVLFDTEIDLIAPDLLTFDDESDNLARTGDGILTIVQAELRGASLNKHHAWHELDEMVGNAFKDLRSVNADKLNDATGKLASFAVSADAKQMAVDAAERFEMRPMGAAFSI
jgi:hypothetical protein